MAAARRASRRRRAVRHHVRGLRLVLAASSLVVVGIVWASASASSASDPDPIFAAKKQLEASQHDAVAALPTRPKPGPAEGLASASAANAAQGPEATRESEIINTDPPPGPFSVAQFSVTSFYEGPTSAGDWYLVYVGSDPSGDAQARIFSQDQADHISNVTVVSLATLGAPVTITFATDAQLTISDSEGTSGTLDLDTLTFTS